MDNILTLHNDLRNRTYQHGGYDAFKISDPKPRDIHKATVCDRLLHHAIYRKLYPFFDRTFISDSYSCRVGKGTHRAMNRFRMFAYKLSKNHTRTAWVLKCDIRKFFASIDQKISLQILNIYIKDEGIINLLENIITSFHSIAPGKGLPLGNLTSQLLVNIYMNEFDQHMKHKIKVRYYIRYADDFVIIDPDKRRLTELLPHISQFLTTKLHLTLHPEKVFIKTFASGIDFLGWVHFPDHRVLRTTTKRRMLKRLQQDNCEAMRDSYLGLLKHGNAHTLVAKIIQSD
jgi:RNA-directed DNA polymerase